MSCEGVVRCAVQGCEGLEFECVTCEGALKCEGVRCEGVGCEGVWCEGVRCEGVRVWGVRCEDVRCECVSVCEV